MVLLEQFETEQESAVMRDPFNKLQDRERSRRAFLRDSAKATAGILAFPAILPSSALGKAGTVAPSERIVMGCIGMGGRGTGNMRTFLAHKDVQVVAVCDVDQERCRQAVKLVDDQYGTQDCRGYNDFRRLLEEEDLDALTTAVPDHWHALMGVAAAKEMLDIYAEKPLALTVPEGRAIVDAVRRTGIIWQTGCQQRSGRNFRHACELVRNGRIGTIERVEVRLPTGSPGEIRPEMTLPEGFDYDLWLGPAPRVPYTKERCHYQWRWNLDYAGGQLSDWIGHHGDIANWGMGTDLTGPIEVEGEGEYPREGIYNTAVTYRFKCWFPKGASPVAPEGFPMIIQSALVLGTRFIGTEGWVDVSRSQLATEPASLMKEIIGPDEIRLYESLDHHTNFLDCVRVRGNTVAPPEQGQRAATLAHLGNIAMLLGRAISWDPVAETIPNDAEACRMLSRPMRSPWHV